MTEKKTVLDLCRMLDLPPAALFMALFPPPPLLATTARLLGGLGAVHPQTAQSSSPDVDATFGDQGRA